MRIFSYSINNYRGIVADIWEFRVFDYVKMAEVEPLDQCWEGGGALAPL